MDPTLQYLIDRLNQLSDQFQELRAGVLRAVHIADEDPEMALIRSRKVLEYVVRDVFVRRVGEPPGTRPLENLIQRLVKDGHFPPRLEAYTETIRRLGNVGAHHFGQRISASDVYQSLTQLMPILEWYFEVERPEAGVRLDLSHERRPSRTESEPRDRERTSRSEATVVPKGLRSFDSNDSDFFLQLLPGPRDKDGLPESIRFWKHRIEAFDDPSFTVGVIYGASGCGKSSLVKAGLLPRLGRHITTIYLEATPEETEVRILNGLRKKLATLPMDVDLKQAIIAFRQGPGLGAGQKVVLVLDQFEQWLHAHRTEQDTELARSLRQCDGDHVQCVLMVRDDFWVSLTRFMGDLGIEMVQGQNTALVDLFDPIHARQVLAEFGRSFGRIPASADSPSRDQEAFLNAAVEELSQEGRVVPIRLALFAEMVKGKAWTPATLKQVGGTGGVGVAYLEETFNTASLRPRQIAGQSVLKALLPETSTDIKGRMRSHEELIEAVGSLGRSREFNDLLRTLDTEVRLITPTDPEGREGSGRRDETNGRYYQLTHDYLVPSLREWLTRKQRETRRGRAALRLAERSSLWSVKPENRHLLSVGEWANAWLLTRKRDWTEPQRKMMRRAGWVHGMRVLGLVGLIVFGAWGGIEGYGNLRATALVEKLETASTTEVPAIINQLTSYRRWAVRPLDRLLASTENESGPHLRASLASLALRAGDWKQAEYLEDRLLAASPVELPVVWGILREHDREAEERLRRLLEDPRADPERRFRAACALANSDAARVGNRWDTVAPFLADRFLTAVIKNPGDYSTLIQTLRPVRQRLLAPLASILRDTGRSESERNFATTLLADYASDEPALLADLLMDADPKSFATLFPIAQKQASRTLPVFQAEIQKEANLAENETNREQVKDRLAARQAHAAVAVVRMNKADEVWPLLKHSADPRLRSFIVNWLKPLGADPKSVVAGLSGIDQNTKPTAAPGKQTMDAVLFHPETSMRRALVLALGTYGTEGLSPAEREPLIDKLLGLYHDDPDAGIHGASEWTLRQWKQQDKIKAADADLMKLKDPGNRRWIVNGQGQTFAVIDGPVGFLMGSPSTEPDRDVGETLHRVRIPRRFAVALKEVSVEQYRRFVRNNPDFDLAQTTLERYSPDPSGPMICVSWYGAAAYCNWLSKQEGLPEDQWCYVPAERTGFAQGMTIPADVLRRNGYRLPTEAEWEYACRSGSLTSRYHGISAELLRLYAWYHANGQEHAWSCGSLQPNDLGLFDMLGNAYEWCQDGFRVYQTGDEEIEDSFIKIAELAGDHPRRLRGGSFDYLSSGVRSADRSGGAPSNRHTCNGFRPYRTCP
jgi:eukaryotic-like serine/threonine-protein kinase